MKSALKFVQDNREKILIITANVGIICLFIFGFAWLHHEAYSTLRSDRRYYVEGRFILDDQLTRIVYDEVKRNVQVKKVERVRRLFPGSVEVVYQKRNPVAAIKKGKNLLVIDEEGILIDLVKEAEGLVLISGVAGDPPGLGRAWGAADVEAGTKMARIVASSELRSLVCEIDVSNTKGRVDRSSSHIDLVTRSGCRLMWGKLEGPEELSVDEKIKNLRGVLREHKTLDNIKYVKLWAKDSAVISDRSAGRTN
jgi:hypothetical protein